MSSLLTALNELLDLFCGLRTDWKLSVLPKTLKIRFWPTSIILLLNQASLVGKMFLSSFFK